ncbi:MAG TPA: M20 family metallopeptidase, partial [Candidatus Binatia bacterium]
DVRGGIAHTGVVAVLRGEKPGRTIAWRADMDALPLAEKSGAPFASVNPGVMHACGHDGHTAIAIMLAETLTARRSDLAGTAVFIFQPAEEVGGGAWAMLDAGVLENPPVDAVFGLHLVTKLPVGHVALRAGPVLAAADYFTIDVKGKGGHGALPHQTIDPIPVAAHIVLGMENLIAREIPAREAAVLTIGQISAGSTHNIIPGSANIRGTLRTLNPELRKQLKERAPRFVSSLAQAFQAQAEFRFEDDAIPAVINDDLETARARRAALAVLGEGAVSEADAAMTSDDIGVFLEQRPGCYFWAGIGPSNGVPSPHHSPEFIMNEAGLMPALQTALAVMDSALRG